VRRLTTSDDHPGVSQRGEAVPFTDTGRDPGCRLGGSPARYRIIA
jgi:hypothetical protein